MSVVEILCELIRCKSITPEEAGSFAFIHGLLDGFSFERMDKNGVSNLFVHKKFGEGPHLCFAGHLDVVPPGDGWESDPFEPVVKEGFIYGRGAQDMKSGVAAFLGAVKKVGQFNGTLSLLLTSDEEGPGVDGTQYVLQLLQGRGGLPDMAVVAEPTCGARFGDTIKVGRRGSINGVLKIFGKGGHAAYPEKSVNPIHLVSKVLPRLSGVNLDEGDEHFAPSRLVLTDIRAGYEVTNLTPGELKIMFNVRNSTATTEEDVSRYVKNVLDEAGIERYEVVLTQGSDSFLTKEGPFSTRLLAALGAAIEKITAVTPAPSTTGGTSDARYFSRFGVDVVEFGVQNDTIHAPNERTPIKDLQALEMIFSDFIERVNKIES